MSQLLVGVIAKTWQKTKKRLIYLNTTERISGIVIIRLGQVKLAQN